MKVSFTSENKSCTLDTQELNPAQTRELEKLIKESCIITDQQGMTWFPAIDYGTTKYEIVIEDQDKKVKVYYEKQTLPSKIKPLVNYLKKNSRPIK